MERKSTDDLRRELQEAASLDDFLKENDAELRITPLQDRMNELLTVKKLSKASLAKRSGMSEVYIHQIFSGRRNPSRNRLICLACGFGLDVNDTQDLLQRGGHAPLYARSKRDAIIIFGLDKGKTLFEINDLLFEADEESLS